jgi:hypothetical protein
MTWFAGLVGVFAMASGTVLLVQAGRGDDGWVTKQPDNSLDRVTKGVLGVVLVVGGSVLSYVGFALGGLVWL